MRIPSILWDVQPSVRMREAIPEEVTQSAIRDLPLQEVARVFQVNNFPVSPRPWIKKGLPWGLPCESDLKTKVRIWSWTNFYPRLSLAIFSVTLASSVGRSYALCSATNQLPTISSQWPIIWGISLNWSRDFPAWFRIEAKVIYLIC